MKEKESKKKEERNVFVRYKRDAPGRNVAITVHGVNALRFERGVPHAITESEKKILIDDRGENSPFEVVDKITDVDVPVKKEKPRSGIVQQKEIDKEEKKKVDYDPSKDKDRDVTKAQAYGLDRPDQEALLKARKVKWKSTDKEQTMVLRILKSNPGYNK